MKPGSSKDGLCDCRRIVGNDPVLSDKAGRILAAERLPGLTNHVYRIITDKGTFVLRIPRTEMAEVIDRSAEFKNLDIAAGLGVAVPPLYSNPSNGVLLSHEVQTDGVVTPEALGACLAELHKSAQPFVNRRDVLPYLEACVSAICSEPDLLALVAPLAGKAEQLLASTQEEPRVPNHFDPSPGNLLPVRGKVMLIDFEYAAMAPAAWDLAYACLENGYSMEEETSLLAAYRKAGARVPKPHVLSIYKVTCDVISALWALDQALQGNRADDFVGFAKTRVLRAQTHLHLTAEGAMSLP